MYRIKNTNIFIECKEIERLKKLIDMSVLYEFRNNKNWLTKQEKKRLKKNERR